MAGSTPTEKRLVGRRLPEASRVPIEDLAKTGNFLPVLVVGSRQNADSMWYGGILCRWVGCANGANDGVRLKK
jgi:hypothetical protein